MLRKVEIDGLQFPQLWLAENGADVRKARDNGIPYIKWKGTVEDFVRVLLRPTLEKMFPGVDWNKVLGRRRTIRSKVIMVEGRTADEEFDADIDHDDAQMLQEQLTHENDEHDFSEAKPDDGDAYTRQVDIAGDTREITGGRNHQYTEDRLSVYDYIGDISSSVNIDVLQKLRLLPKFVGDIANCIKRNLSDHYYWTEGFNKKLGVTLGNFKGRGELPNLIILDVSASIPDGIAATMLTLIDTLREQCGAELIITSARSGWYPIGAQLPNPQTLRNWYGRSNEAAEFCQILNEHIAGREFGHVISFGDNDSPAYWMRRYGDIKMEMVGTKVHAVHHFHTWDSEAKTGYARWVDELCDPDESTTDCTWCSVMDDNYKMGGSRW